MSPIEDFIEYEQKTASPMGMNLKQVAMLGAVGAGTTAAVAGILPAANAIYNAATKGRDFRSMLEFDPELKELHKQNPKYINAGFNTLRRMNTDFSRDPMVASAFVKQVAYGSTEGSFGLAQEALRAAPKPSQFQEAFAGGAAQGVGAGLSHQTKMWQMAAEPGPGAKAKAEHGYKMQQIQEQERLRGASGRDTELLKHRMSNRAQGLQARNQLQREMKMQTIRHGDALAQERFRAALGVMGGARSPQDINAIESYLPPAR